MRDLDGQVHVWRSDRSGDAASQALRRVLAVYLDASPEKIELETGPHGKPRLKGEARLRFNLSHSADLLVIAVTLDREVGIDVERIDPGRDAPALARRALPPEDAAAVATAAPEERAQVFHAAWARLEAVAKCLGTGLSVPAAEPATRREQLSVVALDLGPGFAAALAVEGEAPTVRRFELEPQ
ncbi:MAG TPA: 4'-phosphopantetheinyl transferase superfamily protein [Solirubrobacterales bacterium]|nr:4'-phosphopantetheinyl transferase superfamily protein [Solirubrobacterales bacterium]